MILKVKASMKIIIRLNCLNCIVDLNGILDIKIVTGIRKSDKLILMKKIIYN